MFYWLQGQCLKDLQDSILEKFLKGMILKMGKRPKQEGTFSFFWNNNKKHSLGKFALLNCQFICIMIKAKCDKV